MFGRPIQSKAFDGQRLFNVDLQKKLVVLHAFTYTERLELLGMERLESRRIRADVLFAYKLLLVLTALHSDYFFI